MPANDRLFAESEVCGHDSLAAEASRHFLEAAETFRAATDVAHAVAAGARLVTASLARGGKLLLCGNGGSAADCQHLATEFTCRLSADFDRPPLAAVALTTDGSFLTAFPNDFGFENVFARQVRALGVPGDVLLAISTSGESENVVRAAAEAKRLGLAVIALSGRGGGRLAALADVTIDAPGSSTMRIQEVHLGVEHVLCFLVERMMAPRENAR